MKIVYSKTPDVESREKISELAYSCGILYETARLLYCRGLTDKKSILRFLSPSESHLHNPLLLSGIKVAISRIKEAKERGERVLIFGDYDADGVCATKVLTSCLNHFGVFPDSIIPERENGYGLNLELIEKEHLVKPIGLIITVDCGISDGEKIDHLKSLGIDVIVTDHHEPPEILPSCIRINPKIKGQEYPFQGLCGAGVAYKLGYALIGDVANEYLDFVSLATIADSMDLLDENRDIVSLGLKIFNNNLKECFKYLLPQTNKKITARDLGFTLAPKINAGGRMGDINTAKKLFFAKDSEEIFNLSVKLSEYNIQRQTECLDMFAEAKEIIVENKLYNDRIICVSCEKWKTGLIAIVAAKLTEEFSRPTIVFGESNGNLRGSARSVDGINIFQAISANKDTLLAFGGHSQAAGITLEKENFNAFREGINQYAKENFSEVKLEETINAEWQIEDEFNPEFAEEIERLEPFGPGFLRPLFTAKIKNANAKPLKADSLHLTFKCFGLEMLYFYGLEERSFLNIPSEKTVVFETNVSYFNRKQSVKGFVKKVFNTKGFGREILPYILENQLENARNSRDDNLEKIDIKNAKLPDVSTVYAHFNSLDNDEIELINGLDTHLFERKGEGDSSFVLISPSALPQTMERVVYLERPLYVPKTASKVYFIKEGNSITRSLSLDREDFTWVYSRLLENKNKEFQSIVEFFENEEIEKAMQGVFASEVFMELGFFKRENGKLISVYGVRAPLTDSYLYNLVMGVKSGL